MSDILKIGRVLHEDDDFVTLEIGKRDDVTFHLQQDESGETVGGDRFFTVVFVHADKSNPGNAVSWDPFAQ